MIGEMALEERFVDGNVLDGDDTLAGLQLDHAVDQEEGVAMRQQLLNLLHVHRQLDGITHDLSFPAPSDGARNRPVS